VPVAAEVEPKILCVAAQPQEVRYEFWLDKDLRYFQGHFPGLPLLPGVVQAHWAQLYARRHFQLPAKFAYLSTLKFMRIIEPDSHLHLLLRLDELRCEVEFEYRCNEELCSQGVLGWSAEDG
jgi:3-hydroxymyristoyl/3-hydroxydecanoyl-(acyl carrier protein) dehydratase